MGKKKKDDFKPFYHFISYSRGVLICMLIWHHLSPIIWDLPVELDYLYQKLPYSYCMKTEMFALCGIYLSDALNHVTNCKELEAN